MPGATDSFSQFLLWERSSRDSLDVKRVYIDMAGDLVAGVVLSQIVYWHLPSRDGRARLQVEREGKLWLAKGREEWWDECRISPKQADRALEALEVRGLIEVKLFKFGRAPRKHIRIREEAFLEAWKAEVNGFSRGGEEGEEGPAGSDFDQASKSMISTFGRNRSSRKVKILDIPQRGISLDTESTTENTASSGAGSPEVRKFCDAAADSLAKELISHGVGKCTAERLAREKPDASRRCLEYLPFARPKSTKGAWLANAIRDEYGPPPGFEAKMAKVAREEEAAGRAKRTIAREIREQAIRDEVTARLALRLRKLEEEGGKAYRAFCNYVDAERTRVDRVARLLSPARREALLSAFDDPARRLEIFAAWESVAREAALRRETSRQGESGERKRSPLPPGRKGGLFSAQAS
jgi:hypothetical protein